MRTISCLIVLSAACAFTAPAATLALNNAALTGAPGDTVGWDFTITSTAIQDGASQITPWLLITFADFQPDPGFNPVGIFTAFITQPPNSNIVIGPDAGNGEINPWSQPFDPVLLTGIGSYLINDFQSFGDAVPGTVVLLYDEYRHSPLDPAFDPSLDTIDVGQSLTARASVTVGAASAIAPEPSTIAMLISAALALAFAKISTTARLGTGRPCRSNFNSMGSAFVRRRTLKPRCWISCAHAD